MLRLVKHSLLSCTWTKKFLSWKNWGLFYFVVFFSLVLIFMSVFYGQTLRTEKFGWVSVLLLSLPSLRALLCNQSQILFSRSRSVYFVSLAQAWDYPRSAILSSVSRRSSKALKPWAKKLTSPWRSWRNFRAEAEHASRTWSRVLLLIGVNPVSSQSCMMILRRDTFRCQHADNVGCFNYLPGWQFQHFPPKGRKSWTTWELVIKFRKWSTWA